MKAIIAAKLAYLHVAYWLVGMDEEGFQITRGDYLFELGNYSGAAEAYRRALADSPSPLVHGRLGCCYLNLGLYGKAVELLEKALERKPDPVLETALAWSFLGLGDASKCRAVVTRLRSGTSTLDSRVTSELAELEAAIDACDARGTPRDTSFERTSGRLPLDS